MSHKVVEDWVENPLECCISLLNSDWMRGYEAPFDQIVWAPSYYNHCILPPQFSAEPGSLCVTAADPQ